MPIFVRPTKLPASSSFRHEKELSQIGAYAFTMRRTGNVGIESEPSTHYNPVKMPPRFARYTGYPTYLGFGLLTFIVCVMFIAFRQFRLLYFFSKEV